MDNIDRNIFITIGIKMKNNEYNDEYFINIGKKNNNNLKIIEIKKKYIEKLTKQIEGIENKLKDLYEKYEEFNKKLNEFNIKNFFIKDFLLNKEKKKYIELTMTNILEEINENEIILEKLKCIKMIHENSL
jgi:hypothetical protein